MRFNATKNACLRFLKKKDQNRPCLLWKKSLVIVASPSFFTREQSSYIIQFQKDITLLVAILNALGQLVNVE